MILTQSSQPRINRQRGTFLTVWLTLIGLVNLGVMCSALYLYRYLENRSDLHISVAHWLLLAVAAETALNIVGVVALWNWKKWGFLLLVALWVAGVLLNLLAGISYGPTLSASLGGASINLTWSSALGGLLGLVILSAATGKDWDACTWL